MNSQHEPRMPESTVYLSAPVNALVNGIYEENVDFSDVKKHGDFGLGTFDDLDGEMIMLDGGVFQISSDGHVTKVHDNARTPFAMVTFFRPTIHDEISAELSPGAFVDKIIGLFPSPNIFYAIRIEGAFSHIKARSVPKQANYHPFVDVAHSQTLFDFQNPVGTLAGFFTPAFMSSLSVPGLHLHYLSGDLRHGGHVLECAPHRVRISIQAIHKLELALPMTDDYLKGDFCRNVEKDLNKVEK